MTSYDVNGLLQYEGPSTRTENAGRDWIAIMDYKSNEENERVATLLLSSQGIPFQIKGPALGWTQPLYQLYIIVPGDRLDEAMSILAAAAEQELLELLENQGGRPGP